MQEVLLKSIVAEFSKDLAKQSSSFINDLKGETSYFFDDGIGQYLNKQKNKYAYMKTLLHRSSPVYFYDIYLPARLTCDSKKITTDSINRVFWESQFITIIGDAGSGKSTLVKHLFLNSIAEKFCIPILIELRYLNDFTGSIEDYIKEKIFENKLTPNEKILIRLLKDGKFVFFLDGYDEIRSDSQQKVVEKLNNFIDKYRLNRYLLTSRPYSNIELLPLFHNYKIENLNDDEIKKFISSQNINQELNEKIIKSISESSIDYIKSYLTNPLLLTLYILTFSTNSSIPQKKYIFYRRVLDVLFKEHDSITKIGYERELATNLSQEEFEEILKIFSFISYFERFYDFEKDYLNNLLDIIKKKRPLLKFNNNSLITDLKSAINLWTEDGGLHAFAHRSMQEYFAALYIKGINENKDNTYSKVQSKLFNKRRHGENSNFLSLLNEMDEYNFKKFMLLPALKIIKSKIDETNNRNLLKSSLCLFFTRFTLNFLEESFKEKIPSSTISPNSENYQYIFAIEEFEKEFVNQTFKILKNKDFIILIEKNHEQHTIPKYEKKVVKRFIIQFKNLKDQEIELLSSKGLITLSKKFNKYLNEKIEETEDYLEQSCKSEQDLIDLL